MLVFSIGCFCERVLAERTTLPAAPAHNPNSHDQFRAYSLTRPDIGAKRDHSKQTLARDGIALNKPVSAYNLEKTKTYYL